ncbi:E3 ubiquitin-protein ligase TRIM71-like [Anneissia japonica]|uniref:E3 ubiquitin-protein ligase TRIM71-like n=1 Tax=Anneissia japonica TaxID=1529436 RepID=UPI001425B1C2|nr:E3 ubiquitin-protein ligase TRIM71-like [Anneissia japonica]
MGNYISIIYTKIANWQKPVCSLHKKELEFYCNVCKTPICQICTNKDHKKAEGKHEPIRASDAFNDFKATANSLMVPADFHKQQAQVGICKCIANVSEFDYTRNYITKDINDTVEEIVRLVRESGSALERKLGDICGKKDCNSQIDKLKANITDVEEKQDCIKKLLTCGEATALLTCHQAVQELQQKIAVFPETKPRDDVKAYFYSTKHHVLSYLKKQGIGSVSENPNENIFEIVSENPITVTCYQPFRIEITQTYECEIDINDLTVSKEKTTPSSKQPEECTSPFSRIVQFQGKYFVEGSSKSDLTLDVKFCNSPIKGSPIKIIVEPVGIVRSITNIGQSTGIMRNYHEGIQDFVMFENGSFLVVCTCKYEIFKFENTGAYISTIKLPNSEKIFRICKLKKTHKSICCITNIIQDRESTIYFVSEDGQVIKSILIDNNIYSKPTPSGIDVNDASETVYVAYQTEHYVKTYNMLKENSQNGYRFGYGYRNKGSLEGQMKGPSDVAVTKEGNLIVSETDNHRVQLFGSDGKCIKVLIGGGDKDGMVIRPSRVDVDYDDNIIVVSEHKVQLFDKHGKFLRVIHQLDKGEDKNFVISIASHYPRRLAIAEVNSIMINVINY